MSPLLRLCVAAALAFAALAAYNAKKLDAENLALGTENQAAFETWNGQRITAARPDDIAALVEARQKAAPNPVATGDIMWLGNSQLHTINQFKGGDHLAPYWLAENTNCGGCVVPLGLSLPNANLQEQLILAEYVLHRLKISLVIVKLVFDDLREDGIRGELVPLITPDVREALQASEVGREIVKRTSQPDKEDSGAKQEGLHGFAQAVIEEALDRSLASVSSLWAERANLRSRVFIDVYEWRNWAFGITPSTVRRVIPARYQRNMQALDLILASAKRVNVPVLAYIAPIRNDVPLPYDERAYGKWIGDVEAKAQREQFTFLNLEKIVPNAQWGSIVSDNIDYMHFQGAGHKILAEHIWPVVQKVLPIARSSDPPIREGARQ